jgi:uncharacterized membrane protein YgaE (UPF0421/DUF939 family)
VKNEPVLTVAAIQSALAAVIALVVAFGVTLTPEQTAAIVGVWATLGPILFAVFTRGKVTPAS